MSFFKKAAAACLAVSTVVAPVATQISTAVASRAASVMAVGAAAVALPGVAHAQSGKRICGSVWGVRGNGRYGYAAIAMEVYKWDVFTCTGLVGAWAGLSILPNGVMSLAQGLFNNAAGVGTGLTGSIRMMQTCENFSSSIQANQYDVCLSMTDYKLYKFAKVVGGPFAMGRV